jgi:hypothetical protein
MPIREKLSQVKHKRVAAALALAILLAGAWAATPPPMRCSRPNWRGGSATGAPNWWRA